MDISDKEKNVAKVFRRIAWIVIGLIGLFLLAVLWAAC